MSDNPFDRYDIDPLAGPEAITERFRELIEEAHESERSALRAQWEELITHPRERLRIALRAFPETGPVSPGPTPAPRATASASLQLASFALLDPPLAMSDLALAPSIAATLGASSTTEAEAPAVLPPWEKDPCLGEHS